MSDKFVLKRVNKMKVGETDGIWNLEVPLPTTDTGKVNRLCPQGDCSPRLFLIGARPNADTNRKRQIEARDRNTYCPYCGKRHKNAYFLSEEDKLFAIEKIRVDFINDIRDEFSSMFRDFNRNTKNGLFDISLNLDGENFQEPQAWREDLLREMECPFCACQYGVYSAALYCPACGRNNLYAHFLREKEIILREIELSEQMQDDDKELAYRLLGNAHEDVVTVFESLQKLFYNNFVKRGYPQLWKELINKGVGTTFQNVKRAEAKYCEIGLHPYEDLTENERNLLEHNISKRHVIGHNLSVIDQRYSEKSTEKETGATLTILKDEVLDFVDIIEKIVLNLENHYDNSLCSSITRKPEENN